MQAGIAALAILCIGAFVFSQGLPDQPPRPTFRTEASYVRVDVYPTLRGAPVSDLKQDDFQIVEDKVPQKIAAFEHVVVRTGVPQEPQRDPGTVAESRAMAETTRGRVFVLFLDFYHVEGTASVKIRQPLVNALDRTLGDGDLIAVMTPDMSARDLTFTAKTGSVEAMLTQVWGRRDRVDERDPEDDSYRACYPSGSFCTPGLAEGLIDRRRETRTLDSLRDLVEHLRDVREERKAVLAVTDGWRLFEPNEGLLVPPGVDCAGDSAGLPPLGADPRTGRLGALPLPPGAVSGSQCEVDRQRLARIDDQRRIRDIGNEANRGNVSFYPIDPRGLVATEQGMQPLGVPNIDLHTSPLPTRADIAQTAARQQSLRTLALDTDGTAIVATNDIPAALRRVADDLSSYYLLGYYSTGKLDGKFHAISVRVKRPGVEVRARRGYLASTPAPASGTDTARAAAAAPAKTSAETVAVESAIAPLATYARDVPLRLQVAAGWKPAGAASAAVWVVGELGGVAPVGETLNDGFDVTVTLTTPAAATVATGRVSVARGARTFRITLAPSQPLSAGEYVLRVGVRAGPALITSRETLQFTLPASDSFGALFLRRGQSTGNKDVSTADLRFRRNEQIRVEIPTVSSDTVSARLLDRTGRPLAVPVAAAVRDDNDGSRWDTAQLALTPLAPGDYVIELSEGNKRKLAAFRVVP